MKKKERLFVVFFFLVEMEAHSVVHVGIVAILYHRHCSVAASAATTATEENDERITLIKPLRHSLKSSPSLLMLCRRRRRFPVSHFRVYVSQHRMERRTHTYTQTHTITDHDLTGKRFPRTKIERRHTDTLARTG